MRVVALVESFDHVCCRYRLRAFAPILQTAGIDLEYVSIPRSAWSRWQMSRHLREADAVILQRKLLSRLDLTILRPRINRLIFDMDDAVWLRDSHSKRGFTSYKRQRRFRAIMRHVDLAVCGNDYLATNAKAFGAKQTTYIPTCVDVERYPLATHTTAQTMLVWVGSSSTLTGLEHWRPTLNTIGQLVPNVSLKLICDRFFSLDTMPVIECPWKEATETQELALSSIGISWIPDDPWSRGKCGLKVLQYMAAGLPVLANPVGVHPEMIRHGETGYLVNTEADWLNAVQQLARDPDLRLRMGRAARRMVEERYSVTAGANTWRNVLQPGHELGPA